MEETMMMDAFLKRDGNTIVARCELYDGTEFSFVVNEHEVKLNEKLLDKEISGFALVTQMSLQDTRAYVRLPNPNITYGSNVLVNKYRLHCPNVTMNDFIAN